MSKFLLSLFLLVSGSALAQLPDNPSPQPKPASFLSFRSSWEAPPLRTNREMFHSKLFIASQAGGALAMIFACRNPRSHENWASEVPAVVAVGSLSYLSGRFFTQPLAVAPGLYEIVHYARAARQ